MATFNESIPVSLEKQVSDQISRDVIYLAARRKQAKHLSGYLEINFSDYPEYTTSDVLRAAATAIEDFNDGNSIDLNCVEIMVRVTD